MLDLVRSLEARDDELAAAAEPLDEAQREADTIGERARELQAFLDGLPAERERLAEASRAARADVEEARAELESVRDADKAPVGALEQAEARLREPERRLGRAEREQEELEKRAAAVPAVTEALEERARHAASLLASVPSLAARDVADPPAGLEGVIGWGPRARAAAFVARSRIDRERDTLIRQAEEAAESVLGEPFGGASVQVVRRRLEAGGAS